VRVGADGDQLTVDVVAHGVNSTVIGRLQAELADPPEYRMRCSDVTAPSYLYGEVLCEGKLDADGDDPDSYRGHVPADTLAKLPAFVLVALTAQVRYPAEVSTKPGAVPLPSPIARTAGLLDRQPSEWGPPSAPVTAMRTAPAPEFTVSAQRSATGVDVVFSGLPTTHPHQVAPWRLLLWRKDTNGDMQRLDPADPALTVQPAVTACAAGWEAPADLQVHDTAPDIDGYLVAIVDPLGVTTPARSVAVA
jgi:hypothetical protein